MPIAIETISNAIETANTWFDSHRVLVVDDDTAYLRVTSYMLNKLGIYTDAATNGAEAIDFVSRSPYTLVLSDLQMPGIDGYSLACRLKRLTGDLKVVIMTGLHPDKVVDYMKTGLIDSWIFKPFGLTELRNVLNELIDIDHWDIAV